MPRFVIVVLSTANYSVNRNIGSKLLNFVCFMYYYVSDANAIVIRSRISQMMICVNTARDPLKLDCIVPRMIGFLT